MGHPSRVGFNGETPQTAAGISIHAKLESNRQERAMTRTVACAAACVALALLFNASEARAQQARVEVGLLQCMLSPGVGALVGSRRRMSCRFIQDGGMSTANYTGSITRFGVDVGATAGGLLSWRVFSRTRSASAIAGNYVGVSADLSMGLGAGATVLIGGTRRTTMLQPVAFVGNIGINFAIGITGMTLRPAS
jgi:hypothetical protein